MGTRSREGGCGVMKRARMSGDERKMLKTGRIYLFNGDGVEQLNQDGVLDVVLHMCEAPQCPSSFLRTESLSRTALALCSVCVSFCVL